MRRTRRLGLACLLAMMCLANAAFAQPAPQPPPPHAPQIHATLASSDELEADLKFLVENSGPNGPRAWIPLKNTLNTFLQGIDRARPIITDVLVSASGSQYRVHFPIRLPERAFIQNLDGFGINVKRLAGGFFELKGTITGFMRILNQYASILESPIGPAQQRVALILLPANMGDPRLRPTAAALLAKNFDLGLIVKNDAANAMGPAARAADFQKTKDNLLVGVKAKPNELSESFELRKVLLRQNLEELERFIAESSELYLGWTTDAPKKEARLDLDLSAIAGSSLDASARLLGVAPGMFASVPRAADATLSVRLHFPLDKMRQDHAVEAIKLARPAVEKHIDADKDATAESKEARKTAAFLIFDMLDAGAKMGVVDGMIEVTQAESKKSNLIFGLKVPKGDDLKPVLELLPKIKPTIKVQMAVEKIGEAEVHSIQVPDDADFEMLFGKAAPIHVATGPNVIWVAIGEKSLEQLKAAAAAAGQGGNANNWFKMFVKVGPAIDLLTERRARVDAKADPNKKPTEEEAKAKRDREALRKLAQDAFKDGKGSWETNIDAKDGKVTGSTRFDDGILKFVGAAIAKFSDEELK